jgi:acetyl-CoA carboxylase biotin carboxylase subunit
MNTRIQVEHPVTEMLTGVDLVKEQIRVAAGEKLSVMTLPPLRGHVIECRVNAEDPARNFQPSPGKVTTFHPPGGPGVRLDSHVYAGYTVPPYYDSLLAKLVVWDSGRDEAVARALQALRELELTGVPTTRELAIDILESVEFRSGDYSTSYLAEAEERLGTVAQR